MRRYAITLLFFFGFAVLTLAVGAQEADPADKMERDPLIVVNPPGDMISGAWQPVILEPVQQDQLQGVAAPLTADTGSDTCALATALTVPGGDSSSVLSSKEEATDPVLSCMWGSPISNKGYRTTWYKLTAPINGIVTLDTLRSSYDTVLSVYTGSSCSGLTQLSCSDDHQGFSSHVSFIATKGKTYYVEVADWQADPPTGGATLNIEATISPIVSKWKSDGVMALARSRHATVVVGKDIYVIGGQSGVVGGTAPTVERQLERFKTDTRQWVTLADKPGAGYSNTTAAYVDGPNDNGRIYLPAGYTGSNSAYAGDHWAYDVSANSWITATNAPWPGGAPIAWSAAVANPAQTGYYLTGGISTLPAFDVNAQVHNEVFFYSAQTNSWSSAPPMTSTRYAHTAALVGGRVCVAGGISTNLVLLINGECHTPGSGSWTSTFDMKVPRYAAGSAVGLDGKWYVFGGLDALGNAVATNEVYDPATNSWTALGVPYDLGMTESWPARAWPRGGFVGSTLWSIGGNNMPNNQALSQVDKLFVSSYDVRLPVVASGFNSDDAPDGTFASARRLTMNQPQQQDFDTLLDYIDVYRFDLLSQKIITATLTNIPAGSDYDIALYSANKLLWSESDNSGPLNESITILLNAGTYYIMVERINVIPQVGQNYQILVKD